jgi:D-sedoheptulose 7-phosphate isomerase
MQLATYKSAFTSYFNDPAVEKQMREAMEVIKKTTRIFFVGNGGSNAICSHMMEDFAKIAGYPSFAFTDPAIITCFANDYGYENAMAEWLKIYMQKGDLLVAISSSGKSANILNAVKIAKQKEASIVTLSGFAKGNPLSETGLINFHIPSNSYGVVECYHQVILHAILDSLHDN